MAFTMVCISFETPAQDSASANGFGSQWVDCVHVLCLGSFSARSNTRSSESCV